MINYPAFTISPMKVQEIVPDEAFSCLSRLCEGEERGALSAPLSLEDINSRFKEIAKDLSCILPTDSFEYYAFTVNITPVFTDSEGYAEVSVEIERFSTMLLKSFCEVPDSDKRAFFKRILGGLRLAHGGCYMTSADVFERYEEYFMESDAEDPETAFFEKAKKEKEAVENVMLPKLQGKNAYLKNIRKDYAKIKDTLTQEEVEWVDTAIALYSIDVPELEYCKDDDVYGETLPPEQFFHVFYEEGDFLEWHFESLNNDAGEFGSPRYVIEVRKKKDFNGIKPLIERIKLMQKFFCLT